MILLLVALAATTPAVEVETIDPPTTLAGPWRCRVGDDPAWAQADLDDAAWDTIQLPGPGTCGDEILEVGARLHVVWLRRALQVPSRHRGEPLGVSIGDARGVSEVFVDGVRVGVRGELEPFVDALHVGEAFSVPRGAADDGVLQVAVRSLHQIDVARINPAFSLVSRGPMSLGRMPSVHEHAATGVAAPTSRAIAGSVTFTVLLLLVALYHALVWLLRRQMRGFLWFAMFLFSATGWLATVTLESTAFMPMSSYAAQVAGNFVGTLVTIAFIQFFWHYLFDRPPTRVWRIYEAILCVVAVIGFVPVYGLWLSVHPVVLILKTAAPIWAIYLFVKAARAKSGRKREARVLLIGVVVGGFLGPLELLVSRTGFDLPVHPAYIAIAGFTLTMAIALVVQFTGTLTTVEALNQSIARFVPFGFLNALGRESVKDVERGDSKGAVMTVMFCDIRGFTTLAEELGPDGTFAFLNDYLSRMEPGIHGGGGFINQYYGDGLMALFPGDPAGAIEAARSMFRALDEMNAAREVPVKIGVSLHSGPIWIGTIGGGERLDTGVIGDVVNSTARLEGMTKIYGARCLVSGELLARLDAAPATRKVDVVYAKGKKTPLEIHELLDTAAAPSDVDAYAAAFARYQAGEFEAAQAAFAALDDEASKELASRCATLAGAPPDGWNGVFALQRK